MVTIGGDIWSAIGATGTAFVTGGGLGWLLHRRRERVSHEEKARARLSELRYDALFQCVRATSELVRWKLLAFNEKGLGAIEQLFAHEELKQRIRDAHIALTANMLLLPRHLRAEFAALLSSLETAKDGQSIVAIGRRFADEVESYLPRLRRRVIDEDERSPP